MKHKQQTGFRSVIQPVAIYLVHELQIISNDPNPLILNSKRDHLTVN